MADDTTTEFLESISPSLLSGDMTQTPKQMSTSDMTLLLNSDGGELNSVTSIGENISAASLDVLDAVNSASKHENSQNVVPQTQVVTQAQLGSHVSLLNSNKRVILQPSNPSMNALVQNLVQSQVLMPGVKRPASGQQVVTKFIIQKNPSGGPQPVLVQHKPQSLVIVTSSGPTSATVTSSVTTGTITLSGGVLTASDHAQTIHTTNGKVSLQPGTPTKIRMFPVPNASGKSPQRMIPLSMTKSAVVSAKPGLATHQIVQAKPAVTVQSKPASSLQAIPTSGGKFSYVRVVNNQVSSVSQGSGSAVSLVQSIAKPVVPVLTTNKIQIPSNVQHPVVTKNISSQIQRLILPTQQGASLLKPEPAKPAVRPVVTNVSQASTVKLPDNSALLPESSASSAATSSGIPPGFTLVPAEYINSLVSGGQNKSQAQIPLKPKPETFSSFDAVEIKPLSPPPVSRSNGLTEAPGTRPRKPCNCTKSQCLKLYCDCFANGEFCHGCNCNNCYNNLRHEEERSKAIRSCLDRNPNAFHPKIGKGYVGADGERRHTKGCNCKKSGCLKNYCECYEAKISCSDMCRCLGCKNVDDFEERQNLMALADVAESRVQHIQARKARQQENKGGVNSRLPYTFITSEVGEATCACLLAQAEDSEREKHSAQMEERLILQEYGRCLLQIIESANRSRTINDSLG